MITVKRMHGTRPTTVVRGRFAPSPTGQLHLGNARTALLAWLQMRRAGGTLVLRLENLDLARCRPHLAQAVMADLRWLGLDWDEGPDRGGPYQPYIQSERSALYRSALQQLSASGRAYPCFCSRTDILRAAGAPHTGDEGPRYPGTCRLLSRDQKELLLQAGRVHCWRFRLPSGPVQFEDGLHGHVVENAAQRHGDFVIWSRDGHAAYQLAVVVDDGAMAITDVLRGDDLLASTVRQIWLYRELGLPLPQFTHVPLLLGPDGTRLAKRHGAVGIGELRQRGFKAEAIVGYLAFLSGLAPRGATCRSHELIHAFDLACLSREPATVTAADLEALGGGQVRS